MKFAERSLHFVIAILGISLIGGLAVDRVNPSPVYGVKVLTPLVAPGDSVRIQYSIDRRRQCFVESYRTIVDSEGTRFETPKLEIASAAVGPDTYSRLFRVDDRATEGPAVMRTTLVYKCNPIHELFPIIVRLGDQTFNIGK